MKLKEESEKVGLKLNIQHSKKTKIMASGPIISWQIDGETIETVTELIFLGYKITADGDCSHETKRHLLLGRKAITNLDSILKRRGITLADKGPSSQSYVFSSSHVWTWELGHKEGWALKNWCFWTVVLKKTLESLLDCKEIKPVSPKGNQSWIFIVLADAEATILLPPNVKKQLIRRDPDAGKDWRQEEKVTTEDKMVGWHHWLSGHEFEWAPVDDDEQRSLVCCSSCGHRVGHTQRLNSNVVHLPKLIHVPCPSFPMLISIWGNRYLSALAKL